MRDELKISYIDSLPKERKLRIIWAGIRDTIPNLSDKIYTSSDNTILDYILNNKEYLKKSENRIKTPVIIVWDTTSGAKKYVRVDKIDQ